MVGSVVAALDRDHAVDTRKQDFVYGQGIDEIVMLEQADVLDHDDDEDTSELTRSFYHRNALGSVVEVTDALEVTVCSYRYDPYGAVTITVGGTPQGSDPLGQHWTFTGRFFDEETGFYYYRARMYDPATGRFLQRDPLGYGNWPASDSVLHPTLYAYACATPPNRVDPLGLSDCPLGLHLTAVLAVGPIDASSANAARHVAEQAVWDMMRAAGLDPAVHAAHDNIWDALRHCIWSCEMARRIGEDQATAVANIYERCRPNVPEEQAMDQANNAKGRECARKGSNCRECCTAIEDELVQSIAAAPAGPTDCGPQGYPYGYPGYNGRLHRPPPLITPLVAPPWLWW
jgi:RHS repeat-associated protein